MALFKILSNMDDTSKSLPSNYVKGYCYFNINDGKFWVDTSDAAAGRIALNAVKADELTTTSAGAINKPIYWINGKPAAINATVGDTKTPVYLNAGVITACTDISTVGLTHIGTTEPASTDYVLWVDTDEESAETMRADAVKYLSFSIAVADWVGTGPYTWTKSVVGITENMAIINLTLNAESQTHQKAQLDWETNSNSITLSTTTIPTGTITGYLVAMPVTEVTS